MDDSGRIVSVPLKLSDMSDADAGAGERVRRIVFPDVRDGSVVELRCVQRSRHTRMPEWRFQRGIPVLVSELVYTTCPYLGYSPVLKGARRYDYTEKRVVKGRQRAAYEYEPDYLVLRYGMKICPHFHRRSMPATPSMPWSDSYSVRSFRCRRVPAHEPPIRALGGR